MAFASTKSASLLLLLFFLVALPSLSHQQHIRLIDRDSPESPLFESSAATLADKWRRIHRRSVAYRDHFQAVMEGRRKLLSTPLAAENLQEAGFDQVGGEYLMEFTIGTPPVKVTGMLDVAGDFIWTQCEPCPNCSPHLGPLYDPSKSSTSTTFSCSSFECLAVPPGHVCRGNETCRYVRKNESGVETNGLLISDVLAIDGVTYFGKVPFGCGNDNSFSTRLAPARVGLTGNEYFSLAFRSNNSTPFTFSHCFRKDFDNPSAGNTSSELHLGKEARLNGRSSPLTLCPKGRNRFFSPTLLGMGVGTRALNLTRELVGGNCSIFFTSSTPLTFLKKPFFDLVASTVTEQAHLPELPRRANDPWDLCFNGTFQDLVGYLPKILVSFDGEVALPLWKEQIYAEVDHGRTCLLMAPTDGDNMIGTYFQMNRNIGYDLRRKSEYLLYLDPDHCG
ncbi:probable aspartic protease At2g35615 [Elaeis guineensis]|uniref:probable aspartic protease At2g35615 n=1 Tax=Elaeis guineensis var. tenera TaxID=51953 RepID=UPI003C6D0CA0